MVKSTLSATIFVSSPGDVQVERDSVASTVARWNSRNSDRRGITFKVWTWEENSIPDVGVDAQDVMNAQIPNDFDILVGIFHARLGTPTGRSGSGTQEEIEIAMDRRSTTGSPHIAVYFKKAPLDIDANLEQVQRLRDFEASLKKVSLAGSFQEVQSFEAQINRLLDTKAEEYLQGKSPAPSVALQKDVSANRPDETVKYEDYGLFDVVEESEAVLGTSSRIMNEITDRMAVFRGNIESVTKRLDDAKTYGDVSIKKTRPIIRESADEMNSFSAFIDERLDELSENFINGADLAILALDIAHDFEDNEAEIRDLRSNLETLQTSTLGALTSQEGLVVSINSIPRLDVKTNQAKRRLAGTLGRLGEALRAGLDRFDGVRPMS